MIEKEEWDKFRDEYLTKNPNRYCPTYNEIELWREEMLANDPEYFKELENEKY
jgi:hypothetical protein